jgi:hypothetical protein
MLNGGSMTLRAQRRIREFSYLLTGLGAGILVGGLFAPRSGDASRRLILRKAQKTKRAVETAAGEGTRYITRRGTEVLDQAGEWVDRGKHAYRAAEKMVQAAL